MQSFFCNEQLRGGESDKLKWNETEDEMTITKAYFSSAGYMYKRCSSLSLGG